MSASIFTASLARTRRCVIVITAMRAMTANSAAMITGSEREPLPPMTRSTITSENTGTDICKTAATRASATARLNFFRWGRRNGLIHARSMRDRGANASLSVPAMDAA